MEICITGSSGFVGQNIIAYNNNFNYKVISRAELHTVTADTLATCDAVIHLAAKVHDLKRSTDGKEYYESNFELTKKLYDAFLLSGAQKFIFVSSVKAVADEEDGILTEETIPNPQTHYGKSKLMAEAYIKAQPLPAGKSYYILRPCMIHGPGNKGNLNLLYKFVERGVPYPLAKFDNKRSFLSIENMCFIIRRLLEQTVPSGIYNLADDKPLSTIIVFTILANAKNKKPRLLKIPKFIIISLASIGNVLKLPLNTERLSKLTESYIVSNKKIKKALHIKLPVSAVEGLKLTARSFLDI